MGDHYFGTIKPKVAAFMQELDEELWKLGILSKTKHNEAAPAQHEMAPIYTDANSACDCNQLTMDIMKKVAARHDLVCLLHEKPFEGVNGSGKHDNWSLATDTGKNLFSPGQTPWQNAQFLLFLSAFLKAVDEYPELLRCSVAFAGNDHRLGGHEAPPAIISVFLGSELERIVDSIIADTPYTEQETRSLRVGVDVLPTIPQDTTDRNRTSPIAFTGNKFEFRMPGASQSIAGPTTVLNTVMAESLRQFADILEKAEDFETTLHDVVRNAFRDHKRILFSGNGYGQDWVMEAEDRGLPNLVSAADAFCTYLLPKNVELMIRHGIYTEGEMRARNEVHMEKYCHIVGIEANTMLDMVQHGILDGASSYSASLCDTILAKQACGISWRSERALAATISEMNDELMDKTLELKTALASVPAGTKEEIMVYYHDVIFSRMQRVRHVVDSLETLVASDYWPYPTYTDLLFSV